MATSAAARSREYTSNSMTVLKGLEAVRKRPGMYIGSTSERGLHHLVWEVVDNSVDEALAGYCDRIDVALLADGGVRVVDNGRGIPVDVNKELGMTGIEVALTTLHGGAKFDSDSYAVSGGLHGVGVSVVNALSSKLDVRSTGTASVGRRTTSPRRRSRPLLKGAKTNTPRHDDHVLGRYTIFETTTYSFETISRRLQEMAFLNKGLTSSCATSAPTQIVDEDETAQE